MADGESARPLLGDGFDVGAGADTADRNGEDAVLARPVVRLRGIALRAAVAEDNEGIPKCRSWTPERQVGGGHGQRVDAGEAQQVGALVGGVEAGAGAGDEDSP